MSSHRVALDFAGVCAVLTLSLLALSPALAVSAFMLPPRIPFRAGLSLNWSGYTVTNSAGSVTSVSGSWVVPTLTCSKKGGSTYAAFWAGIDGYNSNTVEQAGVLAQCYLGVAYYSAWYEFYPQPMVTITSVTVRPGDVVSVTVSYSGGTFTVTLTDGSQPSFTVSQSVSGAALSSAECITERPSIGGSLTKLANFGIVSFGQDYTSVASTCYATVSEVAGAFGSFTSVQQITMVNLRGKVLAQPSSLSPSTDGSSFTVTWYASS